MKSFTDFQRKHIQPRDLPQATPDGDPGFSLEHNRRVIEETLAHNERMAREKKREWEEGMKERAWATAKFIENAKLGGDQNVEKYFGKNYIDRLRGQYLVEKYKMIWTDAKKKEESKKAHIQSTKLQGAL